MGSQSIRLALVAAALVLGPAAASAFEFKPYGPGSFAELRKQHAGRPTILHFWSATCPPCLAELPAWAKIARENRALDVVFVNVDQPPERGRAQARLDKAGLLDVANYAFADDFLDRLYFEADPSWRGELPFTALIAADGKLVTIAGLVDDPVIGEWLKSSK
jgi:thiol-disulfide isomerase/thioredoxin